MKSLLFKVVAFALASAAVVLFLAVAAGSFKRIHRTSLGGTDFTEVIVSADGQTVNRRIARISYGVAGINRGVTLEGKFAQFWLANSQDPIFPDAWQLRLNSKDNPALQRYLQLDSEARANDFYLFVPSDFYWPSAEYTYRGKQAQFTCNFIIHVEDSGNSGSRLEVIEIWPYVIAGIRLGWSAHTGPFPGILEDIRRVSPTTTDRRELLDALEQKLTGSL